MKKNNVKKQISLFGGDFKGKIKKKKKLRKKFEEG